MKCRLVIEYEIPDGIDQNNFSHTIAKHIVIKALTEYLNQNEEIRRKSLASLYKINSSVSEQWIEK